jgi:iron complex outermembrane receptor protein
MQDVVLGGDTIRETDLIRRKWLENDFYGLVGGLHFQDEGISAVLGGGWNRYDGDHFGTVIWARVQGNEEIRHRWYENRGIKSDWNSYVKTTVDAGERLSFFADLQLRGINYSIKGADDDLRNITQDHQFLFFNPKAGLNVQVDRDQRIYLFVARANREPNRSNFVDADPAGPVPVKESMLDYEAGYSIQGEEFSLNGNLYFMDYTNQLVLTGEINDVGAAIMTNVKDSYRAGIELSLGARLSSWLRWDGSATVSKNKILDYSGYVDNWDYWSDPENESYQVLEELGATDLSFSPELILKSQLNVKALESMNIDLVSSYVGKQYIDNTSSEDRILSPYFINDLVISYSFFPEFLEEVSLRMKVANLFGAEYETNAWVYRYYSGGVEGVLDGYYPQAGTHLMAGVRLRF